MHFELAVGHLGLRQQLDTTFGFHAQLIANYGLRVQRDESGDQKQLTLQEIAGSADLYFGQFGYLYIGPAALVGYRWYSEEFVQWFAPGVRVQNHMLREGGVRLGFLDGT